MWILLILMRQHWSKVRFITVLAVKLQSAECEDMITLAMSAGEFHHLVITIRTPHTRAFTAKSLVQHCDLGSENDIFLSPELRYRSGHASKHPASPRP